MSYDYDSWSGSVLGGLINSHLEQKRRPIREAKAKKEALEAKLRDYDEYEKQVKKRKGKKRQFSDREIDPKQIQDTRNEYKRLYGKTLLTPNPHK